MYTYVCIYIYMCVCIYYSAAPKKQTIVIYTVHLHFALGALNAVFSVSANSDFTDSSSRLGSLPPFFPPLFLRLLGLRRSVCVTTFSSTLILSVTILTSSVHPLFLFLSLILFSLSLSNPLNTLNPLFRLLSGTILHPLPLVPLHCKSEILTGILSRSVRTARIFGKSRHVEVVILNVTCSSRLILSLFRRQIFENRRDDSDISFNIRKNTGFLCLAALQLIKAHENILLMILPSTSVKGTLSGSNSQTP